VCCIASLAFYFRRRARIILVLIIADFIATALGYYAKLKLSYTGLLLHAIYTISVIGGFYIYIFIDYALVKPINPMSGAGEEDPALNYSRMSETLILVFTSFPLLALFGMGIYSCCLAIMVEEELEARKEGQESSHSQN